MPKKKKKPKTKKKLSKIKRKKGTSKKRASKRKKVLTRKKVSKNKTSKVKNDNSTQETIFKTRPDWLKNSLVNKSQYQAKYSESIKNNNTFWKKEGKRITWIKPYKKIKDVKYSKEEVRIKWYEDGTLNASANCAMRNFLSCILCVTYSFVRFGCASSSSCSFSGMTPIT